MAKIELNYFEKDGLLYPFVETGMEHLESELGKYGILCLRFLHEHKHEMYTELLFSGKLAEHCASIDKAAFEQAECIRADYLDKHPMPFENTMDRIRISTQAQMVADEIVIAELIYW